MARNIRQSRAGYRNRCKWYKKDYNDDTYITKMDGLIGVFYAKLTSRDINSYTNGRIRYTDEIITLETKDKVDARTDDFIELWGHMYVVVNVNIQTEMNDRLTYFINIRRSL